VIKPIATRYGNNFFRSRLEARWGIFFDELGIQFSYELEGYEINASERYLPDFYLPKVSLFAEVKPFPNASDEAIVRRFIVAGLDTGVILLTDKPACKPYPVFSLIRPMGVWHVSVDNVCLDIHYRPKWYQEESRFYTNAGPDEFCDESCFSKRYIAAMRLANEARFEYGEAPAPPIRLPEDLFR